MSTDLDITLAEYETAETLSDKIQAARKHGDTSARFEYRHQGVWVNYFHSEDIGSSLELAQRAIASLNRQLKRLGKTLLAA